MFRELTRKKQALSQEECIALLKEEPRGILSVLGDHGYPYGLPINHWYCEEDGRIYFHSGKTGHKIDALNGCEKASFCVLDRGFRRENEWALNIKSVIVFGRVECIREPQKIIEICRRISEKFTKDTAYIEEEIRQHAAHTLCLALTPEQICGKLVNES